MEDADERYMQEALALADEAAALGEVPVGAVAVHEGVIVGRGSNRRETDRDPFAHAEMRALAEAARTLGRWRLSGVSLVVTLEPCSLCVGAALQARIDRIVYGAPSPKAERSVGCSTSTPCPTITGSSCAPASWRPRLLAD